MIVKVAGFFRMTKTFPIYKEPKGFVWSKIKEINEVIVQLDDSMIFQITKCLYLKILMTN